MRREGALLRLLDREVIPDPDTLGEIGCGGWGIRRRGVGLGQVRDELNARILRRDGPATDTLDADATLVEGEKRDAQWSDKGVRSYRPMLGFVFETPLYLVVACRKGHVSPGAGQLAFYRQCRARMPAGKRIARDSNGQ